MSTRHPPVGIDHLTVVPGNFDPEKRRRSGERSESGRDAESEETDEERADEQPEPAIFEP